VVFFLEKERLIMEKKNIYLCDLSHVTETGLASEYIPYGIGCIKSYFKEHAESRDQFEVNLFKHPNTFINSFLENRPEVVGFSNYCWNSDLSHTLAQEIRRISPETIIIFGGPNYPLDDDEREPWLQNRKAIDLYIIGEAEEPFSKIVDHWHKNSSLNELKLSGIEGCHTLVDNKLFKSNDTVPRLSNLNVYPSPYVKGYMDEFLANEKFIPMTQTARGCPYACTFCDKGSFMWTKVSKLDSPDLFAEEIHYIARNTRCKMLGLVDDNFGLLPRDIELAKILRRSNEELDYPYEIFGTTNKNFNKTTAECIEILKGIFPVTVSVQSLDPEVLKNIKRTNLPLDKLIKYAKQGAGMGASSRSETIVGLPGDSKEKHIQGILKLIDAKITFILPYTLILLDGTELGAKADRDSWGMRTKFRLNHRCFGIYDFGKNRLHTGEIEEVVVALDTLNFQEYLETRTFVLTTSIFFVDHMLHELVEFLELLGIKPSKFIMHIHEKGERYFSAKLKDLYQSYNTLTKSELWDDREALEHFIKSTDDMSKLTQKGIGTNILFRHRATALIDLTEDIIDVAFACTKDLLGSEYYVKHQEYLTELKKFMTLRRSGMFDCTQTDSVWLNYDFNSQDELDWAEIPKKLEHPIEVSFFNTDKKKGTIGSYDNSFAGIMRMIPQVRLPKLFRKSINLVPLGSKAIS
jgi:radical SAM superfamily enzyme YgiQ (UPF0313 family)